MYNPKFESIGPHDVELVELIQQVLRNQTINRPYIEVWDIVDDEDFLNEMVDGINEVFDREILEAQWYEEIK